MGVAESNIFNEVCIKASTLFGRLFRNNVGSGFALHGGHYIEFGLCKGSGDGIGWFPVKITPEMVGKTLAVFASIEVKTPAAYAKKDHNMKSEQRNWMDFVNSQGGFACCVCSEEQLEEKYHDFLWRLAL
jgi:hypothetical protein